MAHRQKTVAALLAIAVLGGGPSARAADPATYAIDANINDPGIDTARGQNLVWLAPANKRVGKLLVFLPLGGAANLPTEFESIGSEAGRLGYHTIVLAYKNEVPVANAAACGNEEAPLPTAPPNCAINARMEILNGADTSPVITVNRANSIENRLNKLLQHLATDPRYAADGWSQFRDANGEPNWSRTIIAGASLGAGQAALVASQHSVPRVALFSGWTDAKHGWATIGATPPGRYYSLIHARELFYPRTCAAYAVFGMAQTCPLTDPAELAENRRPPYGTRQLVFNLEHDPTAPPLNDAYLPSTTRDPYIAKAADGSSPSPALVNFWRATLGDSDADSYLDERDNCPLVANADQTDSDGNTTGDACGPTFAQGTVGGSVPATLTLTLGPPATFGAFTPSVTRSYEASTTATVTSTAGDASLSSAEPGHLTNATFSLPEPLQVSFSKSAWTGPASNEPVTISFKQPIKATDALRTGVYSRTLTFTLSTTAP